MDESIVVTGAASGIGKEIARNLARRGVALGLIDKNCPDLLQVAMECESSGAFVDYQCLDITSRKSLESFMNRFVERHGRVTSVFINAGIGPTQVSSDVDGTVCLMETNYLGAIYTISSILGANSVSKTTSKRLVVVSSGSIASIVSTHSSGPYSASKAALTKYLDSMRIVSSPNHLRIVDVRVGFVLTPMTQGMEYLGRLMEQDVASVARKIIRLRSGKKTSASIPFWRNLIWVGLSILPTKLRNKMLQVAYKRFRTKKSRELPTGQQQSVQQSAF